MAAMLSWPIRFRLLAGCRMAALKGNPHDCGSTCNRFHYLPAAALVCFVRWFENVQHRDAVRFNLIMMTKTIIFFDCDRNSLSSINNYDYVAYVNISYVILSSFYWWTYVYSFLSCFLSQVSHKWNSVVKI